MKLSYNIAKEIPPIVVSKNRYYLVYFLNP
jgi:hypothetical protein